VIASGYERDRLDGAPLSIRWWLYLEDEDGRARPQAPRKGVVDRGFHFARGGRVDTPDEAEAAVEQAYREALYELDVWRHQPSHALGPGGQLIPLDHVVTHPELDRAPLPTLDSGA
jgi:hypothetical protein